jgi:predicted glycoside hydrolase/deacetylase ChbG (UPF0249 family)
MSSYGKRKLIVNADDFGLSKNISEGIIFAHEEGIVTSTSVLVNQHYFEEAIKLSEKYKHFGVGLHLNFNKGIPIASKSKINSLLDNSGVFFKNPYEKRKGISQLELYLEFKEQVNYFIKVTGKKPSHIDCHHWNYLYREFFVVYLEISREFGLPIRLPLIESSNFSYGNLTGLLSTVPLKLVSEFPDVLKSLNETDLPIHADYFEASFYESQATKENLIKILDNIGEGVTELMTHPGFIAQEEHNLTSYNNYRETELKILTNVDIKKHLEKLEIKLINFTHI